MSTPEGLTTTPLHGQFVEPNALGTPLKGTLTFTPNPAAITFPDENVIVMGTETATLDDNGEFIIELISTDQGGENPTGWTYSVTEKLVGQKQRSYLIALPDSLGLTVELADITPTEAAPTYIPVVGPPGAPGLVTSVNGHSSSSITLTASDVGAVDVTDVGVAGGVASLDGTGKIPVAQIPDISATYVTVSEIGAASGVAGLNSSGLVISTQLDLAAATPTAIATAGAVGVATKLAREDHTHAGVNLTSNQSIGGTKNFTAATQTTQLGVGVVPGTQRVHVVSTVDEIGIQVDQTTVTGSSALFHAVAFDNSMIAFSARVNGDSAGRVALKSSGNIEFGPGNAARDTTLYRSATGVLNSNQFSADAAAPTASAHLTRKDYVDGNFVNLTGAQTISGAKTFTAVQTLQGGSGTVLQQHKVTGDTNNRLQITTDGLISLGPGNAAVDVTLSRGGAGILNANSLYQSTRAAAGNNAFASQVSGDGFTRFLATADGGLNWGPGNATRDTNLYRSAAGVLTTDGSLTVGGSLTLKGTAMGETQTYTPTWAGFSNQGASPTKWGYYWRCGNFIVGVAGLTAGTSPSLGTGTITVSLPVAAANLANFGMSGKVIHHPNDGGAWKEGTSYITAAGTTATLFGIRQTDLALVSPGTAGWTFIAGSTMEVWFQYPVV